MKAYKKKIMDSEINSLSPSGNYYFQIRNVVEIWGNVITEIKFMDRNKKLIYHRPGFFSHQINKPEENIEFVKWNQKGNCALFYEFKREFTYDLKLIDLEKEICYRGEMSTNLIEIIENEWNKSFFEVEKYLQKTICHKASAKLSFFNFWKP